MSLHEMRYSYASGFKSRKAAESAIDDMMGDEIALSDKPEVEPYHVTMKGTGETVTRYRISLIDSETQEKMQKRA